MKSLILPLVLVLGACAAPPPRSAEERQQDVANAACRQDVERVMRYRERGQQMRTDEAEARIGAGAFNESVVGSMSTERLSAQFQQQRMLDRCLRGANSGPAQAAPSGTPAGGGRGP